MPAAHIELLTALGKALGCTETFRESIAKVSRDSRNSRGDIFPALCYYSGPLSDLGPAPARRPLLAIERATTPTERDAIALRQAGEERLLRFYEMLAVARRKRQERAAC
jgi:hypothetical protein